MKTSELLTLLQKTLQTYGDLDVQIESSQGEYQEAEIEVAGVVRSWCHGDKFPKYTGERYVLLSACETDQKLVETESQ